MSAEMTDDESVWSFKGWYAENKDTFNQKRRSRYQSDEAYRKRVLDMNRASRDKRHKERVEEDQARRKAVKLSVAPSWKETIGEDEKPMLTIGALARVLSRSTQSIRQWEKSGLIPKTPNRTPRGDRLYSPEQVLEIHERLKNVKGLSRNEPHHDLKPVSYLVEFADGRQELVKLFRVGVLAKAVDRTVLTIEQMEHAGVFPPTPFTRELKMERPVPRVGNLRYYTYEMIEAVKTAFDKMGGIRLRGEKRQAEFKGLVSDAWAKLGVLGAKIINAHVVEPEQIESEPESKAGSMP